jgi:hypothetical protein
VSNQEPKARSKAALLRRHLLNHGQHQLAVAVVEADGVSADLAEKADFVIGQLRKVFVSVGVSGIGEELRQRDFHGAGNFGQRVERRNSVAVLDSRQVAAQKTGALFDVPLGHASLQAIVSDGLANVHRKSNQNGPPVDEVHSNQSSTFWQEEFRCTSTGDEVAAQPLYSSSSMYKAPAIGFGR